MITDIGYNGAGGDCTWIEPQTKSRAKPRGGLASVVRSSCHPKPRPRRTEDERPSPLGSGVAEPEIKPHQKLNLRTEGERSLTRRTPPWDVYLSDSEQAKQTLQQKLSKRHRWRFRLRIRWGRSRRPVTGSYGTTNQSQKCGSQSKKGGPSASRDTATPLTGHSRWLHILTHSTAGCVKTL